MIPGAGARRSTMPGDRDPTGEVTELLQQLIRNGCVNDGTPPSGQEVRSADTLEAYLDGPGGFEVRRFEPAPGRARLPATMARTDPAAPSPPLLGHTPAVPAHPPR